MAIRIDGTNTTANPGITGADADTGLQFGTDEVQFVTGGTNRATVESNGNLTIEDGNLVVASGHGIDFSDTANGSGTTSSELLDDYEEGTWTADIKGSTTAGSYTSSKNTGNYTKVGNLVKVDLWVDDITTVTAGSGSARITGLPFSVKTGNNQYHGAVRLSEWNVDNSTVNLVCSALAGDEIAFLEIRDALSASTVAITDKLSNNAYIMLSVTYMAA